MAENFRITSLLQRHLGGDLGFGASDKNSCVTKQKRNGLCYFLEFQSGMIMGAAEKLQPDRVECSREIAKYRLTIYAVLLTILGLIIKLVYDKI